jgi:type VI secretion system protein ImpA
MVDPKLLRAELMNVAEAEIATQAALVREGQGLIAELCGEMNARMKEPYTLDMSTLSRELDRLAALYGSLPESSPSRENTTGEGEDPGRSGVAGQDGSGAAGQGRVTASREGIALLSYHATTRTEALALLKKGAEYFQTQEPNSPIPYLIDRALRFSDMNFIELIEDMAPDAVARGRDILGIKQE